MPAYDFRAPRLYLDAPLAAGAAVRLEPDQRHYLLTVLRLGAGDTVLVFNGRDGEWLARIDEAGRKATAGHPAGADPRAAAAGRPALPVRAASSTRASTTRCRKLWRWGRRGCSRWSRGTPRTARINLDRMRANAIEAAEQCGILTLPAIAPPVKLDALVAGFEHERLLVFCDEDAEVKDPVAALAGARPRDGSPLPIAVLIGPEGGFAPEERDALLGLPRVVRLALGPRILRADTAAVAALALTQAVLGDWR